MLKDTKHLFISDHLGLIFAILIIGLWFLNITQLLSVDLSEFHTSIILCEILLQTFLSTGLFITTHEAIHGLVYPKSLWINQFLGSFCAFFYAFLSYKILNKKHWLHHKHPMTECDPDCGREQDYHFFSWYIYFIKQYWHWKQLFQISILFSTMNIAFKVDVANIGLFWITPLFLSSLQLFYFGTYRPHGLRNDEVSQSTKTDAFPWFLSLLTCYHFGYHTEHHDCPNIPWWKLPALYQARDYS